MASQSNIIDTAVEGVLQQIQKNDPAEYAKLNAEPSQKKKIIEAARAAASETLKLNEEFAGKPQNIEERLTKHLSHDRIKLIKEGLNIPTFSLEIAKKQDGHFLKFTREGKEFLPERKLASNDDIDYGKLMQYASILVEGIALLLSAVGVSISPDEEEINEACKVVVDIIKTSPAMQKALKDFIEAWNAGSGASKYLEEAKALFYLLKASYSAGILWKVVKILCSKMSWYDWLKTAAKVTATAIAAFESGGAALIAKIAHSLMSSERFTKKITNIKQLSELQN